MSHEYAMSRVKDALDKSDGNHLKAQRLLLQWLEKDHSLLLGIVAPHLQSIITYAINHAAVPHNPARQVLTKPATPPPSRAPVSGRDAGEFGAAVLESLKGGRAEGVGFGEAQPRGAVSKPGQASQKHIDAINKIAGASKSKSTTKKKKD